MITTADRQALEAADPQLLSNLLQLKLSQSKIAQLSEGLKNSILIEVAAQLESCTDRVLEANALDLKMLSESATGAFRDRLTLSENRINLMAASLRSIAALKDPVGQVVSEGQLDNGLKFKKIRSPLGCLLVIFESRPNVITEVFALAFKSGNAVCIRGGKESLQTAKALFAILRDAIRTALAKTTGHKLDEARLVPFVGVETADRALVPLLLRAKSIFDVCIPRGGDGLIELATREAAMPLIKNDRGLCHLYVHADADIEMAKRILMNGKTQRPGVCNSIETLLLDQNLSLNAQRELLRAASDFGVELRVSKSLIDRLNLSNARLAEPQDFETEHLDLILNVAEVQGLDGALDHIAQFGSRHSEAIVTRSSEVGRSFLQSVDAACTYWNASTRFTDGYTLGLGGEIGISTQKLHVRGPVGLNELTSVRWIFEGAGQVRDN